MDTPRSRGMHRGMSAPALSDPVLAALGNCIHLHLSTGEILVLGHFQKCTTIGLAGLCLL